MSCDALYRAKRTDNGAWVEGFYFERKSTLGATTSAFIIQDAYEQIKGGRRFLRSDIGSECFSVDPATAGKYIGLLDMTGRKIFSGDILEGADFDVESGYGVVNYFDGSWEISNGEWTGTFHENYDGCELEVIGNIHDNPELLRDGGSS